MRAIFKWKLLTRSNSARVNLPERNDLVLKKASEKYKYEFHFTLQILQIFSIFDICEHSLPDKTYFDLFEKCGLKCVISAFLS